jgi:hypothetical protein
VQPESDWRIRLREASRALETTPGIPDWLTIAVRRSETVAEALAPSHASAPPQSDFFYPH